MMAGWSTWGSCVVRVRGTVLVLGALPVRSAAMGQLGELAKQAIADATQKEGERN